MKTALVTGASGYVGKYLIPQLRKNNYSVRCLARKKDNPYSYLRHYGCEIVYGDVRNKPSLELAFSDVDIVIHLAAITKNNDPYIEEVNVAGTKNIIELCKKNKIKKIVFLSSTAAIKAIDLYGKSKKHAEELITRSGLPYTILRPGIIYSEDAPMLNKIIRINRKIPFFTPIIGDGKYPINPVYIDDVISAIILVLSHKNTVGKTYTIVGPENISFNNFIDVINKHIGIKRKKIHIPFYLFYAIAWFLERLINNHLISRSSLQALRIRNKYDIDLAQKDFNYNPIGFDEGMAIIKDRLNNGI